MKRFNSISHSGYLGYVNYWFKNFNLSFSVTTLCLAARPASTFSFSACHSRFNPTPPFLPVNQHFTTPHLLPACTSCKKSSSGSGGRWGKRVNRGRSLKMAASLGSGHRAGATAVAATKSPLVKTTDAKGTPDNRSQSQSRDFESPPPPKKVRVEERSAKPKKLSRDGGVGGNGSGKEKLQQPTKSYSSGSSSSAGLWSVSPFKTNSSNPPVPATGGSQPPSNTHKVFKQSDFLLHKAPSSSKPKKPNKDKQREKAKGGGEEKKKHKLLVTPGTESTVNNNNNDICRFNNSTVVKRENGDVMLLPKGRPSWCTWLQ